MSDTFAYCGCQYEPTIGFQNEHWKETDTGTHCDCCDLDVAYQIVEYGLEGI